VTRENDRLVQHIRESAERRRRWLREGEPSLRRYIAQAGVLGWMIVLPMLLGTWLGRWLDTKFATGIFWTAPLMLVGLAFGCLSAWRWMHRQ
jgi:ATP synthase protein I